MRGRLRVASIAVLVAVVLAAAVTPIMKLLVAVEIFIGNCMKWSSANTLNAPLPIPSRPERMPEPYMTT